MFLFNPMNDNTHSVGQPLTLEFMQLFTTIFLFLIHKLNYCVNCEMKNKNIFSVFFHNTLTLFWLSSQLVLHFGFWYRLKYTVNIRGEWSSLIPLQTSIIKNIVIIIFYTINGYASEIQHESPPTRRNMYAILKKLKKSHCKPNVQYKYFHVTIGKIDKFIWFRSNALYQSADDVPFFALCSIRTVWGDCIGYQFSK